MSCLQSRLGGDGAENFLEESTRSGGGKVVATSGGEYPCKTAARIAYVPYQSRHFRGALVGSTLVVLAEPLLGAQGKGC